MFPVGMCEGHEFQDFKLLYSGLCSYLVVVCLGSLSFPAVACLVSPFEIC